MSSKASHSIKQRSKPNDIFITPVELAKAHIEYVGAKYSDSIWYDPFKNTGNYYNNFPEQWRPSHKWSEILEGKDFFEFDTPVDVICSNPPYSCLDKVFQKSIELDPKVISYLIGQGNLTTRRIEIMNKAGYGLTKLKMVKVWRWYGMSYIVVFEKGGENVVDYCRKVYK